MWVVAIIVSLMEDQESMSGLLLLHLMKLVHSLTTTVPVLTLIKQMIPPLLQYSWGTITSAIQPVKADINIFSMMMILCGMEPSEHMLYL